MTLQDAVAAIGPADAAAKRAAELRHPRLTKPPGSLGRLEELSIQVAAILGTEYPAIRRKSLVVAAADHGVVAQGVTAYPQEITAQMVLNFLAGGAAINVMARTGGVDIMLVDAGIRSALGTLSDGTALGDEGGDFHLCGPSSRASTWRNNLLPYRPAPCVSLPTSSQTCA